MKKNHADVLIIGAGLSGLACAVELAVLNVDFMVLEADDRVGGRVKTDRINGFSLDHGFQVLQTAYPEAQRQLDFDQLDLSPFVPGVMIRIGEQFHRVSDPLRRPFDVLRTLRSPIGSFMDRIRILKLWQDIRSRKTSGIFQSNDQYTIDFLKQYHFSDRMIDRFFKPFFAGACLDPDIKASSRVFQFLFSIFAGGDATLPAQGMGAIPEQMAKKIPADQIRLNARVESIKKGSVTLATQETIHCKKIIIAAESPEIHRLLGIPATDSGVGETCLYFSTQTPPVTEPFLMLNANTTGYIRVLTLPSLVTESYAPPGRVLCAAVVLGKDSHENPSLVKDVSDELTRWFGPQHRWQHLKTYHIPYALPRQAPPMPDPYRVDPQYEDDLYVCGEFQNVPGIQWALLSGRRTAESVWQDLKG